MAIANSVGNSVLLAYQSVSHRTIQQHEPDLPKFQDVGLIRREITRHILPVFCFNSELLERGFTFVHRAFDSESHWRRSTSRVWDRVNRGVGYFDDRCGRFQMTVPAHLREICFRRDEVIDSTYKIQNDGFRVLDIYSFPFLVDPRETHGRIEDWI